MGKIVIHKNKIEESPKDMSKVITCPDCGSMFEAKYTDEMAGVQPCQCINCQKAFWIYLPKSFLLNVQ